MPKRRRKKKSPSSNDKVEPSVSQQPEASDGPRKKDDTSAAPKKKKKATRGRRKKKPTDADASTGAKKPDQIKKSSEATSSNARKTPKSKSRSSKTDERRKKQQAPKTYQGRRPREPEPPPAPAPARGRRTGMGASGQPRKGRTAASLLPPEPAQPSGHRKPTRPKSPPPAATPPRESRGERPPRYGSYAKPSGEDDRSPPAAKKQEQTKRPERKEPVSKSQPAEPKKSDHQQARESAPVKPGSERDQQLATTPTDGEGRKKKRRRRKRKSAESRPAEQPAQAAPVDVVADEPKPAAEASDQTSAPKKKTKKQKKKQPEQEKGPVPPFGDLVLSDDMLEALANARYQEPTPVQAGLIPKALEGHDLMGQARTGTGKTAAFGIPLLEKFGSERRSEPAALILVPTRELAVQVRDELTKLAGRRKVTTVAVYGGKPIRGQIEHLRRGAEIVVGTPGRVIDLIDRRALILSALECVVLDEADRMLDIGFRPDIEKILRRCPQSRQTLLLSATIPPPVKRLAERYMHEPEMLDFSPQDVAVETIEQFYFTVDPRQKFDLLTKLIEREDPKQAIVFCRTKKGTDRVGKRLARKQSNVAMIHGDLQQRQRDRVMADFRAGKVRFLVATDVVGRGIDVSGISHIINFDIPEFCDDYVHRVGRTGRMGREGVAYTFVSPEEGNELTRIEMRINRLLIRDEMPGFLAVPKPEPTEIPDAPETEPPKPKPVFGKRTRRIRRAL